MDDKSKQLTPTSISTTSFADKAKEYETISTSIADNEADVAKAEYDLKEWLNENNFGRCAEDGKLTDLWDKIEVMKPAEVDTAKTAELRKQYGEKVKKLVSEKIDLQKKRNKLTDVKNYIVFLKEITGLAPRPQGKDQKGGGGQQKPQE